MWHFWVSRFPTVSLSDNDKMGSSSQKMNMKPARPFEVEGGVIAV